MNTVLFQAKFANYTNILKMLGINLMNRRNFSSYLNRNQKQFFYISDNKYI